MSARVLVVDDILPNVKLLEAKLTQEYYEVVTALNGPEALIKIEASPPDIVLLDVMMPGMDGFEVCRRIKTNPLTAHIPVVMVTALTDPTDRVRGLEVGADDFLSKPINDTALMSRVRSLVRYKMTVDEWRARENTASSLGMVEKAANAMQEPAEQARILVVEDQYFDSEKFIDALKVDNDVVIVVETGAQAMTKILQVDFDLMAISLNLTNEDGLRLCSHLRSSERTRSIPILMIATEDDMPRVVHGLEIGAHDYIMRPVDRNELLARVRTQVRRKRFQERLRSTYEVSLSLALIDSLTGLYNRRYLEAHLQKLLLKNEENKRSLGVLVMDIDHFKKINDSYGHGVGDEILKIFAERLKRNIRGIDMVARLGGEEFVVLLPDIPLERAYIVAERLRRSIAEETFPCSAPEGAISVTTSIGGAMINSQPHGVQEVIDRADKQLYIAKEHGRNVCVFEDKGALNPAEIQIEDRRSV